jgi:hypothetical protein
MNLALRFQNISRPEKPTGNQGLYSHLEENFGKPAVDHLFLEFCHEFPH